MNRTIPFDQVIARGCGLDVHKKVDLPIKTAVQVKQDFYNYQSV